MRSSLAAPVNTWTSGKDIPPEVQRTHGKRLDYIFYRPPTLPSRWSSSLSQPPSVELVCVESEVVVKDLVPGQAYSYSDHFGLRAKFDIVTSQEQVLEPSVKPTSDESTSSRGGSEESANSASSSTPLTNLDSGREWSRERISNTAEEFEQALHHHRQVHQRHSKQLLALLPWCVFSPWSHVERTTKLTEGCISSRLTAPSSSSSLSLSPLRSSLFAPTSRRYSSSLAASPGWEE